MTAQRKYDLLINETEAVGFDYCKPRLWSRALTAANVVATAL
jgi:hypothetical protein